MCAYEESISDTTIQGLEVFENVFPGETPVISFGQFRILNSTNDLRRVHIEKVSLNINDLQTQQDIYHIYNEEGNSVNIIEAPPQSEVLFRVTFPFARVDRLKFRNAFVYLACRLDDDRLITVESEVIIIFEQ